MNNNITFELDYEETQKAINWIKVHKRECDLTSGTIGGRFSYVFTPTGLGVLSSVKCACGDSLVLTDMDKL